MEKMFGRGCESPHLHFLLVNLDGSKGCVLKIETTIRKLQDIIDLIFLTGENMASEIKFGTDGWRGVIAWDFTFENVRRMAQALADYINENAPGEEGSKAPKSSLVTTDVLCRTCLPPILQVSSVPIK